MDPIPPAVADAYRLLQSDLYGHLDEVEALATTDREWTSEDSEIARKLLSDLVVVIRGLLLQHQIRPSGGCQLCAPPWPCPVVTTIHSLLKDPEGQFVALVTRSLD